MSGQVAAARLQQQGAQGGVLVKLIAFSLAVAVVPIGSYFLTLNYVFNGNATYSALVAVVAANIILFSYGIVAVREEAAENARKSPSEEKKSK